MGQRVVDDGYMVGNSVASWLDNLMCFVVM
jgi:hypothetical protein